MKIGNQVFRAVLDTVATLSIVARRLLKTEHCRVLDIDAFEEENVTAKSFLEGLIQAKPPFWSC